LCIGGLLDGLANNVLGHRWTHIAHVLASFNFLLFWFYF
jgi:hypothetical protein